MRKTHTANQIEWLMWTTSQISFRRYRRAADAGGRDARGARRCDHKVRRCDRRVQPCAVADGSAAPPLAAAATRGSAAARRSSIRNNCCCRSRTSSRPLPATTRLRTGRTLRAHASALISAAPIAAHFRPACSDVTIAPADNNCPCCRAPMHVIGEETSKRLDVVPAQFRVIVTHHPKCALASAALSAVPDPARAGHRH